MSDRSIPTLFTDVPPSDDLTLEDHAFMAGITGEMLDAAVQADLKAAFEDQIARLLDA